MIAQLPDIPKWMLPTGQMWDDPRVQYHWEAARQAVAFATHLGYTISQDDIIATLMGVCDGVAYTSETDQERAANPNYAPIECAGEFWVLYQAQKDANSFEDRNRDWPDWADYQDFDDVLFTDLNDDPEDEPELDNEFLPGTSPWQEYIDSQRSAMVDYIYKNAQLDKKWAKSKVYMYASLTALDSGKTFKEALEVGFTAYCANFEDNVASAKWEGLLVWNKGKCKLLPWKYIDPVLKYFDYTKHLIEWKYLEAWFFGTL